MDLTFLRNLYKTLNELLARIKYKFRIFNTIEQNLSKIRNHDYIKNITSKSFIMSIN